MHLPHSIFQILNSVDTMTAFGVGPRDSQMSEAKQLSNVWGLPLNARLDCLMPVLAR
jgi:hypothetical protein